MGHTVPGLPQQLALRSAFVSAFAVLKHGIRRGPLCGSADAGNLPNNRPVSRLIQCRITAINDAQGFIRRIAAIDDVNGRSQTPLPLYALLALRDAELEFSRACVVIDRGRMVGRQGLRTGGHGLQLVDFGLQFFCQRADLSLGLVDFLFRRLA